MRNGGADPQNITICDNDTGKQVVPVPGEAVGGPGSTGWLDLREAIHVFRRSKAKVPLYRWTPQS